MLTEEEILARYGLNDNTIVHESDEAEIEEEPQQLSLAIKTGIFKKENLLTLLLMTIASLSGGLALGYFIACIRKSKEHAKQNDREFQHDLLKMMMHLMTQKSPEIKIEKHEDTGSKIDWMEYAEKGATAPHVRHKIREENRYPYHDEIQLPPLKIEENWGVERNLNGQVEAVYRNSQRYK